MSWQNPGIKIPSPHTCHTEVLRAFQQIIQKLGISSNNMVFGKPVETATALRFLATDADKAMVTIALSDRLNGTTNQVIMTDNGNGTYTLSLPQSIHTGATPTLAGLTVTGLTGVLKAVGGVLTSNADHADLANVTADQHHAKSHLHDGADGSGTVAHSDTTGKTTDDHHAQAHTVASHSDTTATGAELETLTDNSNADALHTHAELYTSGDTPTLAATIDSDRSLHTLSGRVLNTTRATTTYQILVTDHTIFGNTDGSSWTATLPAGVEGQTFKVINSGSSGNKLSVSPSGVEDLLGANEDFILYDGETLDVKYNAIDGWY